MKINRKMVLWGLCTVALVCVLASAGCSVNTGKKEDTTKSGGTQMVNTVTQESQTIGLAGVSNARQLGGYITTDGKKIKDGVLLRTGQLGGATSEDITTLSQKYHLSEVIDLRVSAEIESAPDAVIGGATNERIRLVDESSPAYAVMISGASDDPIGHAIAEVENGTISDAMYSDLAMNPYTQNGLHEFFQKLLAQQDGAFLFHCAGGKDRTGIAAVLLLSALGVDRETIMADFALTNDFNAKTIAYVVSQVEQRTNDAKTIQGVKAEVGADTSYMEKMFITIDEKYGSMDAYLKEAIGLTDKDLTKLRDLYLE